MCCLPTLHDFIRTQPETNVIGCYEKTLTIGGSITNLLFDWFGFDKTSKADAKFYWLLLKLSYLAAIKNQQLFNYVPINKTWMVVKI